MASVTNIGKYCGRCDEELVAKDECFDCDSCSARFHLTCCDVSKVELKARKNSKCLRLHCTSCFFLVTNGVVAKVDELLKFVHKIDLFNQDSKLSKINDSAILQSLISKLDSVNEKIENVSSAASSVKESNSYSNVVKTGNVNSVVVIKPKTKQLCTKTMEIITKNINKKDLNVCNTRNARDGGVVLCCANASETLKAKQLINEKLGADYDVVLPSIRNPRLRISNINADISNDSIIDLLKDHNQQIAEIEMKLVTIINKKHRNYTYKDTNIFI